MNFGLRIELWWQPGAFSLVLPQALPNIMAALLYLLVSFWVLFMRRHDFTRMNLKAWGLFVTGLVLIVPANAVLVLYRTQERMLILPSMSVVAATPAVPLIGMVIVAAIAFWGGVGPGLVAGFWLGLTRSWFGTQAFADVFVFAGWAATLAFLVQQPYKEKLFEILRRPWAALLMAAFVPLPLLSFNRLMEAALDSGLLALDYALVPLRSALWVWLVTGLVVGVALLPALLFKPTRLVPQPGRVVSVFSRSLRARFMVVILPLLVIGIILSILAVSSRALTLARQQALDEMARSAQNAGDGIVNFYYTGANLLAKFAADPSLLEPELRESVLETDRQLVPFFQEMLLTDENGELLAFMPASLTDQEFTEEEISAVTQALEFGMSPRTHLTALDSGNYRLTFVQPLLNGTEKPQGVLLGRVQLDINPNMKRALEALQGTRTVGEGFILDDRNLIIAHLDSSAVLRPWSGNADAIYYSVLVGQAYEDVEGERLLTYMRAVEGTPCTVVMQLPFSSVLQTAAVISNPLLFVQLLTGALLLLVIPFLAARITQPLHTLAEGAHQISQGNLGIPVRISGDDEVAQLGSAFEQMRLRLRARLTDLSLLLNISQSVSATLDLDEGVPLILKGALDETEAAVARFVLLNNGSDQPQGVFAVGLADATFPGLDRAFALALSHRRDPLVNQNLLQPRVGESTPGAGRLQSVAAFPVRTQNRTVALLWVGALQPNSFDEAKVNFLSTLASQAAVLVENARLFQAAEGGRQRLAAILASTTDAILVTEQGRRLLLINPAGQRLLGLDETAYGRLVEELTIPMPLMEALSRSYSDQLTPSSVEISFPDGRTFYASVAPIMADEGQVIGRVAVMRDVTHFKELDEMKSEFVATVSHDLRAPLTFIRGYATMLSMVGDLNDKQQDYLDRILKGIEQMSALIEDLLNLRRIEAGVGVRQESCPLGLILVEAVDIMRARATAKGIALRLEPSGGSPTVIGDRTLLRQAIGNLVDNAIKYTPVGGQVSVGLEVHNKERELVVRISDTGIGIAPEDQVRLFEKFYRIKRRETGDIAGTGLGLALVKSIVERHGGRVWMESELNKGTTFYVALPFQPEEGDAPQLAE